MKKKTKEKNGSTNKKNNKMNLVKYVIICIIIILLVGGVGFFVYNNYIKKESTEKEAKEIKHNTVEDLYNSVKTTSCNYVEDTSDKKLSEKSVLYVVFSKMNNEGKLKDEIDYNDYLKVATSVLGGEKAVPKKFTNYEFDGYSYTLDKKKITRTQGTCGDKKYISKLFGYSYSNEELIVYIKVAYIKGDKLYDLNDKELGDYSEENENSLMDTSTSKIYTYTINGEEYILKTITDGE